MFVANPFPSGSTSGGKMSSEQLLSSLEKFTQGRGKQAQNEIQ